MLKLLSLALVFFTFTASAQIKTINDPNAKSRTISSNFTALSVATGIELYLTQADQVSLAISVNDEKYESGFKTEVVDGVLKIYYQNPDKKSNYIKNRRLKAYLSVKDLNKINVSSGAEVELTNTFKTKDLDIRISSGASLDGEINVTNLSVDQSSGSEVDIKGLVDKIKIDASSGASFDGYGLISSYCTVDVTSGAEVEITVNKELEAKASSGGSVKYKGSATTKNITKSSGGSVKNY